MRRFQRDGIVVFGPSMVGCSDAYLKWSSLGVIVAQNTALYLVAHASVAAPGSQAYLGSVAVLFTELLKAAVSFISAVLESGLCALGM